MRIFFRTQEYEFVPWTPAMGAVFAKGFAFDCETTLIDNERPWITPAYIIGAAFGEGRGYFITRQHAAAFFRAHGGVQIILHNAAFDLAVLNALASSLGIYSWVDRDLVWDTHLLHRLYVLGTVGHTASGKGESPLDHCVAHYLGAALPKDVLDAAGQPVRLTYGQWLNRPPQEMPPVYLEYLAKDALATWQVFEILQARLAVLLGGSSGVWGFVSEPWLAEQQHRWGPQTHHIQLRASIVLKAITANGLHIDVSRRQQLLAGLKSLLDQQLAELRQYGYMPGKGSAKALQGILQRLERENPGMPFPRTQTGLYGTSADDLRDMMDVVPFVRKLTEYRETEKLCGSFVEKMSCRELHPSFNVLARTGRTTSFGAINAQNLPRDDRVRSCFVPSPGHVFIDADYKTIELATLAQACIGQFDLDSKMACVINSGEDLHTLVAMRVTGKGKDAISKADRQQAKPINFGKPGGMADRTLQLYAKVSYGVDLSDEEVAALSKAWFELFPEMKAFLADTAEFGAEVATLFNLTPAAHCEATGNRRFIDHPANRGKADRPHPILGSMCLKVLRNDQPCFKGGAPYPQADVDFFWHQAGTRLDVLPVKFRRSVQEHTPSVRLQRAVLALVGRAPVFTLTGRLRAKASYCARHNTVFQGLAADGAKLALWKLWRAGYRIANFIHDQVLVEVPADSDLDSHAHRIQQLMTEGMTAVVPDVRVGVSVAATNRWYKSAEATRDGEGRLVLWEPAPAVPASPVASQ